MSADQQLAFSHDVGGIPVVFGRSTLAHEARRPVPRPSAAGAPLHSRKARGGAGGATAREWCRMTRQRGRLHPGATAVAMRNALADAVPLAHLTRPGIVAVARERAAAKGRRLDQEVVDAVLCQGQGRILRHVAAIPRNRVTPPAPTIPRSIRWRTAQRPPGRLHLLPLSAGLAAPALACSSLLESSLVLRCTSCCPSTLPDPH